MVVLGWIVGTLLAAAYLRWSPPTPDLAAQIARANVVRSAGPINWWTGWFGGLSLPSYSVLAPTWMATFGVRTTAVIAGVAGVVGVTFLLRTAVRPRAGAVAFAVAIGADIVNGRVTFAIGLSLAVWALVGLQHRRWVPTIALGCAAYLASPLAALFLGILYLAVALVDPQRRRLATSSALVLLVVGVSMQVLFPGTGTMPFSLGAAASAALGGAVVLIVCPVPLIRVATALAFATMPVFAIIPGAVGDNVTRLFWVCAMPLVVSFASVRGLRLAVAITLAALWPAYDVAGQLVSASDVTVNASFYQPLSAALATARSDAGAAARGERVEVLDTVNHWGSVYLTGVELARGWDRQADVADNPIFYSPGALTPQNYRRWLSDLAVGWVAVPRAPLDKAATAENRLVAQGLSYLNTIWSSRDWTLYRVVDATPLVSGASVDAVKPGSVTLTTSAAADVRTHLRYTAYLVALDPRTQKPVPACVTDDHGWVRIAVPRAETIELAAPFNLAQRVDVDRCQGRPQ
ncbi:hypothetical protein SAMN05444157_3505 [Frankineae bacterium MT45]|nr:hypothetical protein SAMN05444157_3505 [Frankineae bacterium MT45]